MNDDFSYAISRFSVSTDEEVLVEHAELVRANGNLLLKEDGVPERTLSSQDVAKAIGAEPVLSEIRPNQVTRITADGVAFDHLPFVLSVPGDPDDFDEALWSKTQADEHTRQDWVVQPGRYRVAYVNESRWCPWPTNTGPRMLPEEWPMVGLSPTWAQVTFCEAASMTSGTDEVTLGLVTPLVAAACRNPDAGTLEVAVWPRNGDSTGDAEVFVRWLLDWLPEPYSLEDGFKALMAQLFVEAECHGRSGEELAGSRLAAGWNISLGFGDTDTSEWNLALNLPGLVGSLALDLVEQRGGTLSAIVTAGRMPESTDGQARSAALSKWEDERDAASDQSPQDDEGDPNADEDLDDQEQEEPDDKTNELNGRHILELLTAAAEDGMGIDRIAHSLGITNKAAAAAAKKLNSNQQIVLTSDSSIAWLPARRLSWLKARSPQTPSISEQIGRLLTMQSNPSAKGQ